MIEILQRKDLGAILKDVRHKKAEFTDSGLMLVGNVCVNGYVEMSISQHELIVDAIERGDPEREAWMRKYVSAMGFTKNKHGYVTTAEYGNKNLVPDAGLNFFLNLIYGTTAKISTWYAAIFTSNTTPAAGWLSNWAGASSGPLATELPNASYDESNRQALVFSTAATSKYIQSDAGGTTFTLASGISGVDAYGVTVNSISTVAYNATDRVLAAATRFDASGGSTKSGLSATDALGVRYKLTLDNA